MQDGDRIHRIFQDPLAQHLLICYESKECFYVGRTRPGKRAIPRLLPKVKGHLFESIAWNRVEQTDSATGPILLGTSDGETSSQYMCITNDCCSITASDSMPTMIDRAIHIHSLTNQLKHMHM